MPGLTVNSPDDVRNVYWAIHASQLVAIAIAGLLYRHNRTAGKPFLIVSVALVLQSVGLEACDDIAWWRQVYLTSVDIPFSITLATGTLLGMLIVLRGWSAGRRERSV